MKRKRRYRCFVCALLCIAALLCGCQLGNRDIVVSGITGSKYVFRIDGLLQYPGGHGLSDKLSEYLRDILRCGPLAA